MIRQLSLAFPFLACALSFGAVSVQAQSSDCGEAVTVQRGDTLSSIAERCDVPERSLLALNPQIESSRDLRVGMRLEARGEPGDGLGRLGSLAGEAIGALSDFARDLGSSAQDLLDKNPDLRQRVERFDRQLRGAETRPVNGSVSVAPMEAASGETLTVSAQGLPSDTPVVIGMGRRNAAYEVIEQTRTRADGTLRTDVRIPDWAVDMGRLTVVVASEQAGWSIRSEPITVTGAKL